MGGARHHGTATRLFDAGRNSLRVCCHRNRPDAGRLRPPQDVDDHRLAGDLGERLSGQPRRGEARRNEDQNVASGHLRL